MIKIDTSGFPFLYWVGTMIACFEGVVHLETIIQASLKRIHTRGFYLNAKEHFLLITYIVPFIKMVMCEKWRVTRETLPVTCHSSLVSSSLFCLRFYG